MGTSRTAAELSKKMSAFAEAIGEGDVLLVREAAQLTKDTIQAGSPKRLRGVGKKGGVRLTVGYNVTTAGDKPAALVFARGPWQFVEHDTKAHDIPRPGRARRRATTKAKRRVVVVPGTGPRAVAHHPGTKGTRPFAKGVERARPLAARLMVNRTETIMRRVF